MIINNTQANIFKVNGGLADIFANRPAASGSFYVFYSIDTQEIFYDSGTWVLIGTGNLPTPTNIYNSDGTLTGNRLLDGNNNDLRFENLSGVLFNQIFGFQLIANQSLFDPMSFIFSAPFSRIWTNFQFQNIGLNIDFLNRVYQFGQLTGGNTTYLTIDDQNNLIKTSNQSNDIGLKLDFANNTYILGDNLFTSGFSFIRVSNNNNFANNQIEFNTSQYTAGDLFNNGNETTFLVDDSNELIKTTNQGNDIGLKLDFAINYYQFGQIIGAYQNLTIDATNIYTYFSYNGLPNGLQLNYLNNTFDLGRFNSGNGTYFSVDDTNQIIKTSNQSNDIGLKLDFANNTYQLGDFNTQVACLKIDANLGIIDTYINGIKDGVSIDSQSLLYKFGFYSGVQNIYLQINSNTLFLKTFYGANNNGLNLDFSNETYQFGHITGGNTTYLKIDDNEPYPIEFSGTNILSGTSGGSSGQHLKIKLNGVDYKIKLENP